MPPIPPARKSHIILYIVLAIIVIIVLSGPLWIPALVALQYGSTNSSIQPVTASSSSQGADTPKNTAASKLFTFDVMQFQVPWTGTTTIRSNNAMTLAVVNQQHESVIVFLQGLAGQQGTYTYELYTNIITATPSEANYYAAKQDISTGYPYVSFENADGVKGYTSQISATSSTAMIFMPNGNVYNMSLGNMPQDQVNQALQSITEVN